MDATTIKDLLHEFWQQTSEACPLEAKQAETQEKAFSEFVEKKLAGQSFEQASSFLMKWLSEKAHPHMMAEVESNRAVLWEATKSHSDSSFVID